MSLILDALRRSEQSDTPAAQVPTDLGRQRHPADRRWRWLLLVVCLVAGGIAGWLGRGAGVDKAATVDLPHTPSLSGVQLAGPAASEPTEGTAEAVIATTEGARRASVEMSELAANRPETTDSGPRKKDVQIAALHQQMWADAASNPSQDQAASVSDSSWRDQNGAREVEAAGANASSIAPPIDLAAAMERAARELGETSLIPHSAVLLENLSQQQKDQVPTIVYTEHDFQENGSSTVELNRSRLRVGQRAGPVTVNEILPDSVVLRVSGITFRLRALNTWVNL